MPVLVSLCLERSGREEPIPVGEPLSMGGDPELARLDTASFTSRLAGGGHPAFSFREPGEGTRPSAFASRVRAPGLQRRGMGCILTLLRLEMVSGL